MQMTIDNSSLPECPYNGWLDVTSVEECDAARIIIELSKDPLCESKHPKESG